MDIWTSEKRSEVMSKIRSKNTKPELLIRSELYKLGYRFRLHQKNLPGKPDIVLKKYSTVIFIHGCFWHYHKKCRDGKIPNSNIEYWKNKLINNSKRDKKHKSQLKKIGWHVITIWECEIKNDITKQILKIVDILEKQNTQCI
ncbi:MAG: DNA mismatch endonuclease Vsr [Ignavibacteriales bacterium]|nr:DNA mismatch endonuclease Vsr [Ignavibacteriales bacterium]